MQRSRLKNIINKSKEISNKSKVVGDPFDEFKKSLPKELKINDNYRLEAAWKAYGSPKDYKHALWEGLIQPIDEETYKLPSIGYNEDTDEYEYLNKGEDNETVAKDIRVWDNDVIPFVKELKHGGYIRKFNKEKDCWTYTKNSQKEDTLDQEQINIQKEPSGDLINSFQKGGKNRKLSELIEFAKKKNPRFVQRMSEPLKDIEFIDDNGIKSRGTHYMVSDKDGKVFPSIQEINGKLIFFKDIDEARKTAIKNNNYLQFNSFEEAENFAKNYKQGWPEFFGLVNINGKWFKKDGSDENGNRYLDDKGELYYFKQGGQMTVIPEGALHARKNNMEGAGEDFTAKGIPVVDKEGEQQAEIERDEIIFRKEVTDKMESLYKKYNSEESPSKKDEIAIEMGKIITCEIVKHTDDKTGLINKIQEQL